MIDLSFIKNFFPKPIADNPAFQKQMLKEYLQLLILNHISNSKFASKLTFIGGTNLRLVKGIDRFSEDLDFDCKNLDSQEFTELTDNIVDYLRSNNLNAEPKQKESDKITAFRRSIYFPELLFDLQLSGHKTERLLIKIESQDQGILYKSTTVNISGCGFFFAMQVPPDAVLCSMKMSAVLMRQKGRDFYDSMFLLQQTKPDYGFLEQALGIKNGDQLKEAVLTMLSTVDLNIKKKDFEHLLFNPSSSERILKYKEFIQDLF